MRLDRARIAEFASLLLGLASTFLGLGVALVFSYGIYFYFERSGFRRTGLVLVAQVPHLWIYSVTTIIVCSLGLVGRGIGHRGKGNEPDGLAGVARRFNNLGIGAGLLVFATLWTMFIARL